ncbi:carbohydrate kinase family protein [Paenibacillus sp. TRM 82003]|nr:carbohydrate kinase family protein [Paenibacillus sp. TRM 82003]
MGTENIARIACIGGANVDRKASSIEKIRLYSSNPVTMTESCGGVARNVAENISRLGGRPHLFSCVGGDPEGTWLRSELTRGGIDAGGVQVLIGERTGTYTALLDVDGEMIVSMADMSIYETMTADWIDAKWADIAASGAAFADTNLPEAGLARLIQRCHAAGLPLYIDPVSSAKARKLPKRLDGVDTLFPNREEAEQLAGMKIEGTEGCRAACERIRQRGARRIVLTLGEEGLFYYDSDSSNGLLPPYRATPQDVTGAGDALAAAALLGLEEGESLEAACKLGLAAASLTVQSKETVSRRLERKQLLLIIKEQTQ